jgi:cephalosporin hydroxylase
MKDKKFENRNTRFINKMNKDVPFKKKSESWFLSSLKHEYAYHFEWLGRPIIQYPQDIIAFQEIVWKVKPEIIIETGIARGGSLVLSASLLELIGHGKVLGIDIDIRKNNRNEIEKHPLGKRIKIIEGSSIDESIVKKISRIAKGKKVLVSLDSNHSHNHVIEEMKLYSPLVTKGSYMIVFDTVIEDIPNNVSKYMKKRSWGKGNNPKTAVFEFLKTNNRFKIDYDIDRKLIISAAPNGYLKCIK